MDYKEAVKSIQAKKQKDNFLVFHFGYDKKFILPHKDGIALIAALAQAEQLKEPYQQQHSIGGLDRDAIITTALSHEEYEMYKISALMRISIGELRDMQAANNT